MSQLKKTHAIAQKSMCAQRYTLGKYVTSVCLDCLFQVQNWLNLKQKDCKAIIKKNHAALEKNPLKTDLSGKRSWCYILHIEKATSKTATQQTSYINNLQLSQAHLRSKCSVRENYLVLLLMLALVTTSESWSIQYPGLKMSMKLAFYAMSAVSPRGGRCKAPLWWCKTH